MTWLAIAALLFVLLGGHVAYHRVLGVFLVSSIAGVLAHIPAGIGVIELVFLTLLGDTLPQPAIIAGLVVYRAVYYFAPLLVAVIVYAGLEARSRRQLQARASDAAAHVQHRHDVQGSPAALAALAADVPRPAEYRRHRR